jgi:hypothetical protein
MPRRLYDSVHIVRARAQKSTCAQLAGIFQEDADALSTWYSGWYNGLAKKHFFHFTQLQLRSERVKTYRV